MYHVDQMTKLTPSFPFWLGNKSDKKSGTKVSFLALNYCTVINEIYLDIVNQILLIKKEVLYIQYCSLMINAGRYVTLNM